MLTSPIQSALGKPQDKGGLFTFVPPVPAAPVNLSLPTISGAMVVGQTATVDVGSWSGYPAPEFTVQWMRGVSAIGGATALSYTWVAADYGLTPHCVVSAVNSEGGPVVAESATVGPIAGYVPVNTVAPAVSGANGLGDVLTTTNGSYDAYPASLSYTYQWTRNGSPIAGATSSTYTIVLADSAASVLCNVTPSNAAGPGSPAASSAVTIQTFSVPVNTVEPVVTGSNGLGNVLTSTPGTFSGNPASYTYAYQWTRNGSAISGATASTYTLVAADSAAAVLCNVTPSNAVGAGPAAPSNSVTVQTFAAPSISGVPTVTGTAEVGQLLTATAATASGNPTPTRTWQWLRGGVAISGATASTYTLAAADGATNVSVQQTETNGIGSAATAVSAAVAVPASAAFDPVSLFTGADTGAVYDLTDSARLFQSSAGSGAVALGNPIGYASDLGPAAKPALQATAASRPVYAGVPRTLGTELVTNGRFATDTDWTKGTGWTIASNTATKTAGTESVLSVPISLTAGKFYFVTFQIARTAGSVTPRFVGGTNVSGTARSYQGSYVEVLQAVTGNTTLEFSADATFAGTVKNVTVKEVTSFVNTGARFDRVDDFLQSAAINASASNKATMIVSFRNGQNALAATVAEFGNYNANTTGSFHLLQNAGWVARARGASGNPQAQPPAADSLFVSTFHSNVATLQIDLAGATIADQVKERVRGVAPTLTTGGTVCGGGTLANGAVTLGRSFTSVLRYEGLIHRALMINRALTPEEITAAEGWAKKGMVYAAQLGDSTVSLLNSTAGMPQAMPIHSLVGGMICGAGDIADAGDRIADQLALWNALPNKTALQAVFIQIGLNDVKGRVGQGLATTADVIADLQNLVNTVNAAKPSGCKTYICGITPCKGWLDLASNPAAAYSAWQAVNTAIAGGGATPITGVDARITSHVSALAGAGDVLDAKYDLDLVHENNEARFIVAQAWRAQLEADGLV